MLYFCNRHKKSVDKASDPVILDSVELIVIQQKFFKIVSVLYCVRLSVRTVGFQPTKRGSIPLRSTI